jgi:hypothetical protein
MVVPLVVASAALSLVVDANHGDLAGDEDEQP